MHACNSMLAAEPSWSFSTRSMKESKPEEWRIYNKGSTVAVFMKEDSGNLHREVFVTSYLPLIFQNLFIWQLLFTHCTMVAREQLSLALYTHGQITLQSKSKTKDNRPIWRVRKRCNCISQQDSMYCQVFSRHQGQGELWGGIWRRTMNGADW